MLYEELYTKLKRMGSTGAKCQMATCVSYQKKTATITVDFANGLRLGGVRLKAAVNENTDYYRLEIPKLKTTVLVVQVGDTPEAGEYYVVACDEPQQIEIKLDKTLVKFTEEAASITQDKTEISVSNKGKVTVKNQANNLKDLLVSLVNEVRGMSIQIIGTAGPYPLTITSAKPDLNAVISLNLLEDKIKNLLA